MSDLSGLCIDRVLPAELMTFPQVVRAAGPEHAILLRGKLWPVGQTLRVRFLEGTSAQQAKAREQAQWWTQFANLHFTFGDDPQSEIRVTFDSNDGAWSYVGTDCRSIPFDQPTMNLGFMDGGTAGHEFGHAIGLGHEHQNPAGGIQWNEAAVIRDLSGPPNNWNEPQIRHNVLNKYTQDQVIGTSFDPDSIMLYFFPARWTTNGVATHANEVLSATDKSFIGSDRAYPRDVPDPVTLTVNAARRTAGSIAAPGGQELFHFTVTDPGAYVIDTRGSTDTALTLFGPDSATALIASDDDSGYGTNARIQASLTAGAYLVQVRHQSPTGSGAYSIRVRRP